MNVELDLYPAETFPLTQAQTVILALFTHGRSFTDSELNDYCYDRLSLPMRYDTPRKRRSDLTKLGLLTTDGSTRPNLFGGQEKVWTLA